MSVFLRPLALLALAASFAIAAEPIKIGHYGSLTGKDAAFGVATRKGVLLAVEEINAKGGVLGRPLEYLVEDIQSKAGESATAVKKLYLQIAVLQESVKLSEATLANARVVAGRHAELIKNNVVSQQDHDNAMAALKTGEADVAAARAAEQTARINLGYTTVTAPVSGRIGRSAVTEGAYVQAAQATLLATVQQINPMYVDLSQSADEVLRLRRDMESGKLQGSDKGQARVRLVTDDGREYPIIGTLQFAEVTVDPGTGSIALRALFPNPKGELLPGMFVRARLEEGVSPRALLVPQVGVTRNQKGLPVAMVVNAEKKVERRQLVTDRAIGTSWLVTDGIRPGDQVIVEGLQKVRPGTLVNPVPVAAPK
ncbi:MAG: efflux RND transporter periplasmic adaptor subunit [Deltaproteobacteria bacterium]